MCAISRHSWILNFAHGVSRERMAVIAHSVGSVVAALGRTLRPLSKRSCWQPRLSSEGLYPGRLPNAVLLSSTKHDQELCSRDVVTAIRPSNVFTMRILRFRRHLSTLLVGLFDAAQRVIADLRS